MWPRHTGSGGEDGSWETSSLTTALFSLFLWPAAFSQAAFALQTHQNRPHSPGLLLIV